MGPKLVKAPKYDPSTGTTSNFVNCALDTECDSYYSNKYNAANTCCMYTRMISKDPWYLLGFNER